MITPGSVKKRIRELLIRSQQYTGTDNVYIAKQGFWASFAYVVGSVLSAGLVIAFANLLPKDTYGTYRYVLSAAGALSFLTLSGMNTALTRATAQGVRGLLAWSVRAQLKFNLLYAAACAVVALYYWLNDNNTLAIGLLVMGLARPVSAALNSYGAFLSGKKEFQTAAWYGSLSNIFYSAVVLGALFLTDKVVLLISAYAVGIVGPAIFFYLRTASQDIGQATKAQQHDVLRYGTRLSFVSIIVNLAQYLDKVILFQSSGAIEVASYALAQAIPERVNGLVKSMGAIVLPKLSGRSLADIRPIFYRRFLLGTVFGALLFAAYWLVSPILFKIALPKYLESLAYSRVLMGGLVLSVPFNYIGSVFRSQKMVRAIFLSSFAARTPAVILYFAFGLTWGVWGMVWANVTGTAIAVLGTLIIWEIESRRLLRLAKINIREVPPISNDESFI